MNKVGNSFYTKDFSGSVSITQSENCAKEIVANLPESNTTFMVIHTYQGKRFAFGYITSNHLFGYIRILEYDGNNAEFLINNGVYNKV